jgi:hypothetical protein
MLPPHVQSTYPVHPWYALEGATWHLTKELADDLNDSMLTYANGNFFFREMYNRQIRAYEEQLESYFSCKITTTHEDFVPISDCIGEFPPSGNALRTLHERAEQSSLTSTGISNHK